MVNIITRERIRLLTKRTVAFLLGKRISFSRYYWTNTFLYKYPLRNIIKCRQTIVKNAYERQTNARDEPGGGLVFQEVNPEIGGRL